MQEKKTDQSNFYPMDLLPFQKRMIIRSVIVLGLNLSILLWTLYKLPSDTKMKFVIFLIAFVFFILFILYKSYQRQIKILQENIVEVKDGVILQHGYKESCNEIDLNQVCGLSRDTYRGYPRIQVKTDEFTYSFLNLKNLDSFQKELEDQTNLKTEYIKKDLKKLVNKAFILFLPSLILFPFVFIPEMNLSVNIVYIVININFIFFVFAFSERRVKDGIPGDMSRRLLILALAILSFQIYLIYI